MILIKHISCAVLLTFLLSGCASKESKRVPDGNWIDANSGQAGVEQNVQQKI
jgi:hypothetical protein